MNPSSLSTAELKRELVKLNAPQDRLSACIERPDFERLYTEMSKAKASEPSKPAPAPAAAAAPKAANAAAPAADEGDSGLPFGLSWSTVIMLAMAAYWLFGSGAGGGGSAEPAMKASEGEKALLSGAVVEARTHGEFESLLALHRDQTGVPVVVDFFSNGCGPCRMIAPTFNAMAEEYKGRAAFVKVNVNTNFETSQTAGVRAMPTFNFYANSKLVHAFQGADTRQLRTTTSSLADKAEAAGTFAGMEVTAQALKTFYGAHGEARRALSQTGRSPLFRRPAPCCRSRRLVAGGAVARLSLIHISEPTRRS
eukprot:6469093-Prymnesium_polylepis.1